VEWHRLPWTQCFVTSVGQGGAAHPEREEKAEDGREHRTGLASGAGGGESWNHLVWPSRVAVSVAFTFCETSAFPGLRERMKDQSVWQGKLACGGSCLGQWVALGREAVSHPELFDV
jgi:hypothetical protein